MVDLFISQYYINPISYGWGGNMENEFMRINVCDLPLTLNPKPLKTSYSSIVMARISRRVIHQGATSTRTYWSRHSSEYSNDLPMQ